MEERLGRNLVLNDRRESAFAVLMMEGMTPIKDNESLVGRAAKYNV